MNHFDSIFNNIFYTNIKGITFGIFIQVYFNKAWQ